MPKDVTFSLNIVALERREGEPFTFLTSFEGRDYSAVGADPSEAYFELKAAIWKGRGR